MRAGEAERRERLRGGLRKGSITNKPQTSNLKPQTSNLKPQTSNLKPQTPNPKP